MKWGFMWEESLQDLSTDEDFNIASEQKLPGKGNMAFAGERIVVLIS